MVMPPRVTYSVTRHECRRYAPTPTLFNSEVVNLVAISKNHPKYIAAQLQDVDIDVEALCSNYRHHSDDPGGFDVRGVPESGEPR